MTITRDQSRKLDAAIERAWAAVPRDPVTGKRLVLPDPDRHAKEERRMARMGALDKDKVPPGLVCSGRLA